jgi:hypothetical protein
MPEDILPKRPSHLFKPGQSGNPKGRPKGLTFTRQDVINICHTLKCNPIEVLAHFANGDSEALGLNKDGKEVEVPLKMRLASAVELAGYLVPKLRSVEVAPSDEEGKLEDNSKPRLVIMLPSNGRESPLIGTNAPSMVIDNDTGEVFQEVELNTHDYDINGAVFDED